MLRQLSELRTADDVRQFCIAWVVAFTDCRWNDVVDCLTGEHHGWSAERLREVAQTNFVNTSPLTHDPIKEFYKHRDGLGGFYVRVDLPVVNGHSPLLADLVLTRDTPGFRLELLGFL